MSTITRIDTLKGYETTRSLLATGGERRGGCCEHDARLTTTAEEEEVSQRDRETESERERERALGPIGIGRALGLSMLILKPLSFQLTNDAVSPIATRRYRVISWTTLLMNVSNGFLFFLSLLFSLRRCAYLRGWSRHVNAASGRNVHSILNSSIDILIK